MSKKVEHDGHCVPPRGVRKGRQNFIMSMLQEDGRERSWRAKGTGKKKPWQD